MLDLKKLWREAPADTPVCTLTNSTKNMVLNAIMDGAKDFESVKKSVPLCAGNECAKNNPSGRGCRENIGAMLEIYVPVYEMMTEGGGCSHAMSDYARAKKWDSCSSGEGCSGCTLCGDE